MTSIDLEGWQALGDQDAARLAGEIAEETRCELIDVRRQERADRAIRIARFRRGDTLYGLVPGGRVAVGYDGGRFVATSAQLASYAGSAETLGLPARLDEYVDAMTSSPRVVDVPTLLVAIHAREAGVTEVAPDHPRIAEQLAAWRRVQERLRAVRRQPSEPARSIEWHGTARVHVGRGASRKRKCWDPSSKVQRGRDRDGSTPNSSTRRWRCDMASPPTSRHLRLASSSSSSRPSSRGCADP